MIKQFLLTLLALLSVGVILNLSKVHAQETFVASFKGETAVTYKPDDAKIIVAGSNDYAFDDVRSASHRTLNGGRNASDWLTVTLPLPSGKSVSADPTLDYDASGNVYYCFTAFNRDTDGTPIQGAIYVSKSTDNGASWGTPVLVHQSAPGEHDDKPWMIVDRSRTPNRIYVSWTTVLSNGVGELLFTYSDDGGLSFPSSNLETLRTGTPDGSNFAPVNHGVAMAVKSTGSNQPLYIVWIEDWIKANIPKTNASTIWAVQSTDGGANFSGPYTVKSGINTASGKNSQGSFRYNSFPSIAVNSATGGYIHAAWCEWENSTTLRIHTKRSMNGSSWTTEKTLNEPITNTDQWSPFVTANGTGNVFISFYNYDVPASAHLFTQSSSDNGSNFAGSYAHSTVSSDPRNNLGGDFTDYIGAIAPNDAPVPLAMWMDFRNGTAQNGRGDVFFEQKGHLTSLETTALSANSQRKVVTNQLGTEFHLIYEDNGEIWYSKSTDEGSTWGAEELVSTGPDKGNEFPSVAFNQNDGSLYVVWQRDLGNGSYDILFNKKDPSSGWGTVEAVTLNVSPPSGTLPQPVITIKRSGLGTVVNRILVMYITSNNSLKYRYRTDQQGASWSGELNLNSSGRFRPSLTPPWHLNVTGVNVADVVSDTGLKLYRNRWATEPFFEGWRDRWQGEELVPASSDPSHDSVINAQIVGGQGNNHLDFAWELDQTINNQFVEAVCYQRKSFYTGQWSAMQEFAGANHQKPTITYLNSGNLVVVWDDGTDVLQAKYTQSTNSWSGVSNLGAGLEPHISTSGGDDQPQKAKYVFRDAASFPYPLKTQSGPAFQKVIAGGNFLPETYARRISATDTLTGAGFLVELEVPKVKTTSGNLYDLPFVVTNDTLLNLSLNNLAPYLNTQSGTLPLDSDSLILEVKIHSKNAPSLGAAGNLIPTVTVRPDATPGLALPVQLANLKVTPKLIQRKSVGLRTLKGQVIHLEMEMQGLNKNRSSLIPVLTHVHYINQGTQLTKGVLDNRGTLIEAPKEFSLEQNYPNPFNPSTVIRYALPEAEFVTLRIYNLNGQEIVTLVEKEQPAGQYQVNWNGRNRRGEPVAAGLYFYRIEAGDFRTVKRMVLLK